MLSHESAAREWAIELVDDDQTDRLTVPRHNGRYALAGWLIRRSDVAEADVRVRDGLRLTSVRRTLRDLAIALTLSRAVAAVDSAVRQKLVRLPDLSLYAAAQRGPGARRFQQVVGLADPRSGSVLESLLRLLLVEAGLLPFQTQHVIRDRFGNFVARVDFCWPAHRLVVEADGFAFHSDRDAYRRDRQRMNELELLGWRVLRFTWEDVQRRPKHVVALISECLQPAAA